MKVKLTTSLGLLDATACELELDEAMEGMVVDVPKDVAEKLIKSGHAVADEPKAAESHKAPEPAKGAPKP